MKALAIFVVMLLLLSGLATAFGGHHWHPPKPKCWFWWCHHDGGDNDDNEEPEETEEPEEQEEPEEPEVTTPVSTSNSGSTKKAKKSEGSSGFLLRKGKTLFGLTSNYDGYGWGSHLGWMNEGRTIKLHIYRSNLKLIKVTSTEYVKSVIFHQKKISDEKYSSAESAFEFLTNQETVVYELTIKTELESPKVYALVDGEVQELNFTLENGLLKVLVNQSMVLWVE